MKKHLKKLVSVMLAVTMVVSVFSVLPFEANAVNNYSCSGLYTVYTSGDYEYIIKDKEAQLVGYKGKSSSLTIPEKLGGYKVTTVAEDTGCSGIGFPLSGVEQITSVTVGNNVTKISAGAFYCAKNLQKAVINNGVKEIGWQVFDGCSKLKTIQLPDSVINVGASVFKGTAWYNSQPNGIVYAGKVACEYKGMMPSNYTLKLKSGTTGIADRAFSSKNNLTKIEIPGSVYYIGRDAFENTTWFKNQKNGAVYAGNVFLYYKGTCTKTISVKVGTVGIAGNAFFDKNNQYWNSKSSANITSITLPSGLKAIGDWAFANCYNMKSIKIPNSVIYMGNECFGYVGAGKAGLMKSPDTQNKKNKIIGTKGTVAEKYANKNGIPFQNDVVNPSSVKLNRGTLGLGVGENYGLVKTVSPSSANQSVTWTSSNTSVATVSSTGNVIGKKAGTATVTVKTSNGKTAKCTVTVKSAPSSIKISHPTVKLGQGESFMVWETTNSGSYANAANLRWTTTTIASVIKQQGTNKALIKAHYAVFGECSYSVTTYNKKTAYGKIYVFDEPSSVKLSASSITLNKGKTYTISESTNSGSYANAANLKWSSTNTKVATVTKGSGNKATIKAVGKGTAYVKITLYNGKTAQCKVTVK